MRIYISLLSSLPCYQLFVGLTITGSICTFAPRLNPGIIFYQSRDPEIYCYLTEIYELCLNELIY